MTGPDKFTDHQGRSGPLMPTGHATEKQAACVDRSEPSNSPDTLPVEADSASGAVSSSPASLAVYSPSHHVEPAALTALEMFRAERLYGVPATWLHRLRYRNIKDMPVSAYGAVVSAYRAACEASERAYQAERKLADARNSKLLGLADFVAAKKAEGVLE